MAKAPERPTSRPGSAGPGASRRSAADLLARLDRWLILANQAVIGLFMAIMATIVFVNVVLRYGFSFSYGWVNEMARYLMVGVTFLGAGLALRHGRLVAMDLLQDLLPRPLYIAIRLAIAAIILAFLGVLIIYGLEFADRLGHRQSPVMRIPMFIPFLAIPVGAALMAVHLLFSLSAFIDREWIAEPEVDDGTELDVAAEPASDVPAAQRAGTPEASSPAEATPEPGGGR